MKKITSFKASTKNLTLNKMLAFFQVCEELDSRLYLYGIGTTYHPESATEFVSYILTLDCAELLIIVEGNNVQRIEKRAQSILDHREHTEKVLCS